MSRYYFDIREGDDFAPDEEGMELFSLKEVQEEAARTLADMVRDTVRDEYDGAGEQLAIEVRDENGPVLQVKFTFEISRHKH